MFKLFEQGFDPTRVGELTYPMWLILMTRGKPNELKAELWQARKVLADFKAGRLKWQE